MLNKIKRTLLILSIILLFVGIIFLTACSRTIGTKPCEVSAQKLPPIRGIRLGMTMQELENAYPYLGGKSDFWNEKDDGSIEISFSSYKFPEQLEGVSNVIVEMFEERVYKFTINYDFKFVPNDHDAFIKQVSESLKMPDALWEFKEERYANLECSNATIISIVGYSVKATDYEELVRIIELKNKKADQKGGNFKP